MATNTGGLPPLQQAQAEPEGRTYRISVTLIPEHDDGDYRVEVDSDGAEDVIQALASVVEKLKAQEETT